MSAAYKMFVSVLVQVGFAFYLTCFSGLRAAALFLGALLVVGYGASVFVPAGNVAVRQWLRASVTGSCIAVLIGALVGSIGFMVFAGTFTQ